MYMYICIYMYIYIYIHMQGFVVIIPWFRMKEILTPLPSEAQKKSMIRQCVFYNKGGDVSSTTHHYFYSNPRSFGWKTRVLLQNTTILIPILGLFVENKQNRDEAPVIPTGADFFWELALEIVDDLLNHEWITIAALVLLQFQVSVADMLCNKLPIFLPIFNKRPILILFRFHVHVRV